MLENEFARVGLLLGSDPHSAYYREVLEHSGIPFDLLDLKSGFDLSSVDVLVMAGEGELPASMRERLSSWMRLGGSIVCSASLWGLGDVLGLEANYDGRHPSRDLVFPVKAGERAWPDKAGPARFFGGFYARATDAQPIAQTSTGSIAASRRKVGKGVALAFTVHVGQTVALMCMGRSVECDAVGPSDGSARLDDHRLRAEDGIALSFEKDRAQAGTSEHPLFITPHADIVREVWIRLILEAVETTGKRLAMYWPWPNNAEGGACISVDCEEFSPGNVMALHNVLAMAGANAAWLVAQPGYALDVYRSFRKWDHEIGLLFSADEDGHLNDEKLKIQHVAMSRAASIPVLSSIRLPDGGWVRYDRLYELADYTGSKVSLSKGGRQPGTSGFAFGTCQPFHPIRRDWSSMRVLEIPYQVFMPGHIVPESAVSAIIDQTVARHGCFHVVVTSAATQDGHVSMVLRRSIALAKHAKLEYMLPQEIARYERTRRSLRTRTWTDGEKFGFNVVAEDQLENLTVLISGDPVSVAFGGKPLKSRTIQRLGMNWTVAVLDLEAKSQAGIELSRLGDSLSAAA
ncbi:MAG: hypothetical protein K1X67_04965 [Fimbriimonadaceae bacterium]|nr:hypothetical protein [Fimbriimonadaceae bacterium]